MAIPKRRVGLRLRLGLWAAIGALMVLLMMVLAREGLGRVARADAESHAIATAGSFQQDGDLTSNAMHASTLESLVVDHGGTLMVPEVAAEALKVRADLESAGETRNPEIRRALAQMRPRVERFIAFAEQVTALATSDRQAALAQVPAFERAFDDLAAEQSALTRLFAGARIDQLAVSHATGRDVSHRILLVTLAVIAAWLLVAILLSRFAVGALASIARVTDAIVRGDRDARNAVVHDDEFGHVAGSVNSMADSLTELIARIEGEAVRDTFSKQLAEAFEISDQEPQVHAVVGRAMVSVAEQTPMELLLADSSEAALERAVEHPTAGAPGCHVTSPFSCVAVRRGTAVVFEDSEALNACPHLRGRPEGARSAACVPVTFMGRALGVLHASAESGSPPGSDQVGRMKVLAEQAGARIGTVRAFQETQLQATTDPLTGALNRRTIENRLRGLLDNGGLVSLAMLDLDHFKQL
ncbi:MAG: hypothetical protein QOF76_3717, partial [Solirubrobacteraceae bacterium]|nr:hypothetical protein [Solirubrobacteraceae bacterium]